MSTLPIRSTYSSLLMLLILILPVLVGCSGSQIDKVVVQNRSAANWVRIDSTIGIKERDGQSVHTDGQRLLFSTPKALYVYSGTGSATQAFPFDKESYSRPVYYQGVAYLIQSETQIKCIPYATTSAPFYISLNELGTVNSSRTRFSPGSATFDALAVNTKGQLLVLANDNAYPQSLYQLQLDNQGRPIWEPTRKSYQVSFPDSVKLSVIRPYSLGDKFYVHSDYKLFSVSDKAASDLTVNKDWSVNYVFLRGDKLYAVIYSTTASTLFLYQSTDKGLTWHREALIADFKSRWTQFYVVDDRLVATADGNLEEFDFKTYTFRSLSKEGLGGRAITGVVAHNSKVYVSVNGYSFSVKDLVDFWR